MDAETPKIADAAAAELAAGHVAVRLPLPTAAQGRRAARPAAARISDSGTTVAGARQMRADGRPGDRNRRAAPGRLHEAGRCGRLGFLAKRRDPGGGRGEDHALPRLQADDARVALRIDRGKLAMIGLPGVDRLHGDFRQFAVSESHEALIGEQAHAFAVESQRAESDHPPVAADERPRRTAARRPGRVEHDPPQPIDFHGDGFLRGLAES